MADKTLPPEGLSGEQPIPDASERRAFLRRAVGIGVPVVLATVRGRSVLAQTTERISGGVSLRPSLETGDFQTTDELTGDPPPSDGLLGDPFADPEKEGKGHGKKKK